jgi:nitroreductase
MDALTAIRSRRTSKAYTGAGISREAVAELVEAATWAPNHRLTQPWRFAAIDREGVSQLAAFVQQAPVSAAVEPRKLPAVVERLAACGAVVQVTCLRDGDAERQREDRDATCAAVQNLLLAATAGGLASYWSTSPLMTHEAVLRWFGADPASESHVATVWLGVPAEQPQPPRRRPVTEVLRWASLRCDGPR